MASLDELGAEVAAPIATVVVEVITTVMIAEVVGDPGSRRLAKRSPVVPALPGDESLANISETERFVDDDESTSCGVSFGVSWGGGFVIVVLN
jgi:hypothetical protein